MRGEGKILTTADNNTPRTKRDELRSRDTVASGVLRRHLSLRAIGLRADAPLRRQRRVRRSRTAAFGFLGGRARDGRREDVRLVRLHARWVAVRAWERWVCADCLGGRGRVIRCEQNRRNRRGERKGRRKNKSVSSYIFSKNKKGTCVQWCGGKDRSQTYHP